MNCTNAMAVLAGLLLAGCAGAAQPPAPQIVSPFEFAPPIQPKPASDQAMPAVEAQSPSASASLSARQRSATPSEPETASTPSGSAPADKKKVIVNIKPKLVINTPAPENKKSAPSRSHWSHHSKSGNTVSVHGYRRKNGTHVHSYHRISHSKR